MTRFFLALRAALAAFLASWRGLVPAAAAVLPAAQASSPYRETHKLPCETCGETANLTKGANQQKEATSQTPRYGSNGTALLPYKPNDFAEAQRDVATDAARAVDTRGIQCSCG